MKTKKPCNFRLDPELLEALREKAKADDVSLTDLIEKGMQLVLDTVNTVEENEDKVLLLEKRLEIIEQKLEEIESKDSSKDTENHCMCAMRKDVDTGNGSNSYCMDAVVKTSKVNSKEEDKNEFDDWNVAAIKRLMSKMGYTDTNALKKDECIDLLLLSDNLELGLRLFFNEDERAKKGLIYNKKSGRYGERCTEN